MFWFCKKRRRPIHCKDCNYFYYPNKNVDGCLRCSHRKRILLLEKYENRKI